MKIDFVFDEGSSKEDTCLIKDNIFGVFDGANSTNKFFDEGGRSGGLIAATIAKETFKENSGSLKDLAIETNRKIKEKLLESGVDITDKLNLWFTMASVVRINKNSFEWLQAGDCIMLVIYKDDDFRLIADIDDHDRETMILWKQYAKKKTKNIMDILRKGPSRELRKRVNEDYGALDGEEKFVNFIQIGEEHLENIKHILLFTDGMRIPKENPEEPDDFDTLIKLFLEGGLEHVKNYIRNIEKDDPNCWKYPRYKQYDDITAISISF